MRFVRSICLLGVLVGLSASSARAQTFTSRASWLAALNGAPTTVDFSSVPLGSCGSNCANGPFSISGATFDAQIFASFVIDDPASTAYGWGSGAIFSPQVQDPENDFNQMIVTLPGSFYAVGFDYGQNFFGDGSSNVLGLSNGATYSVPGADAANYPNLQFFGIISAAGFNGLTVDIEDGAWGPVFDNVSWGNAVPASTTPEPGTMTLLASGLVGMAGLARRRRKV